MFSTKKHRAGIVAEATFVIVGVLGVIAGTARLQDECSPPRLIDRNNEAVDKRDVTEMERVSQLTLLLHPDAHAYSKAMRPQCECIKAGITLPVVPIECFGRPNRPDGN